jgi:serine/threonine protein kinase
MADQAKNNINDSPISGWNRDVLFGLLALNKNLIKVEEFMVVLAQWNSDSQNTFRELFAEALKKTSTELDFIDFLLSEFLKSTSNTEIKNLAILADEILTKNKNLANFELGPLEEISKTLPKELINDAGRSTKPVSKKKDFSASIIVEGEEELGGGGEGIVFKATEHKLSRQIAIKIAKYKSYEERILREGRTLARLQHPGIVPIHFFGKSENGEPFYGMAILPKDGTLLWKIWKYYQNKLIRNEQENHIAFRELIQNLVQVCQTIQFAHNQKIIHRDIKPENIMVGSHGEVYVMDWGSALDLNIKHFDDDGNLINKESDYFYPRIGTYAYVPPEQIQGQYQKQSEQSDVFMLGGILYRILTHKSPFGGLNGINEKMRAEDFDLKPPSNFSPDVDLALESICMKAMQRFPEDRYSSAQAMLEDLTRWLADEPVSIFPEPFTKRAARWARRNRTFVTNAASVLILLLFGSLVFAYSQFIARKEIEQQKTVAIDNFATAMEYSQKNFDNLRNTFPFARKQGIARYQIASELAKNLADFLSKNPIHSKLNILCIDAHREAANAAAFLNLKEAETYYQKTLSLCDNYLNNPNIQDKHYEFKPQILLDYANWLRFKNRHAESLNELQIVNKFFLTREFASLKKTTQHLLKVELANYKFAAFLEMGILIEAQKFADNCDMLLKDNIELTEDEKANIGRFRMNYLFRKSELLNEKSLKKEAIESYINIAKMFDPDKFMTQEQETNYMSAINSKINLQFEAKMLENKLTKELGSCNILFSNLKNDFQPSPAYDDDYMISLINLAKYYNSVGQYEIALKNLDLALIVDSPNGNHVNTESLIAQTYSLAAETFALMKQPDESRNNREVAINKFNSILSKFPDRSLVRQRLIREKQLRMIDNILGTKD